VAAVNEHRPGLGVRRPARGRHPRPGLVPWLSGLGPCLTGLDPCLTGPGLWLTGLDLCLTGPGPWLSGLVPWLVGPDARLTGAAARPGTTALPGAGRDHPALPPGSPGEMAPLAMIVPPHQLRLARPPPRAGFRARGMRAGTLPPV
jgi:hypothetical protein